MKTKNPTKGFTLIEIIVALGILTLIGIFATTIYLNYSARARDLKASNLVYEEGRLLMEKIVREIRQNTVDYEEYFNTNVLEYPLGQNYCLYDQIFYETGFDGLIGTEDDESLGERNPNLPKNNAPLENPIQNNLFLINQEGTKRTYLSKVTKTVNGEEIGKIGMVKLVGKDFGDDHINAADSYNGQKETNNLCAPDTRENDGLIDTWLCEKGYPCNREVEIESATILGCLGFTDGILNDPKNIDHSFVDISPNALNIVDLKFIILPKDNPHKAYKVNEVQLQPYITIQMTVEAKPKLISTINPDRIPRLTLTSTVTTRNSEEVNSSCH